MQISIPLWNFLPQLNETMFNEIPADKQSNINEQNRLFTNKTGMNCTEQDQALIEN